MAGQPEVVRDRSEAIEHAWSLAGSGDVVLVAGTEVKYALNRNGSRFDAIVTVTSDEVDGTLPEVTGSTTVVFADMNGNGTRDTVWITNDGNVQFLEMFPVKPNLLSRVENGIGFVQLVDYGTSVAERARDRRQRHYYMYTLGAASALVAGVLLRHRLGR